MSYRDSTIAVVIPCHNEEPTIGKVVADFRAQLPDAEIIVVDNACTDATARIAAEAGARVVVEPRRGKGFALLTGFRQAADADCVVMVDGDDTYPAEEVHDLFAVLDDGCDMAIGTRLQRPEDGAFPRGHNVGNRLFILLVRWLFGVRTTDLLSGYRILTRRLLEVSPLIAQGFEIETELALQALVGGFRIGEVPIRYRARPAAGASKLRTVRDGYRILLALIAFMRDYRPLTFFGTGGLVFLFAAALTGYLALAGQGAAAGRISLPLVVLSVGLAVVAAVCFVGGIILSSIMRRAAENTALLARRSA